MDTYDFGDGPIPAHRHRNPDGSVGGWVAETAYVDPTAYVGPDARVDGSAQVGGSAWVNGSARVNGSAWVGGSAWVNGSARVDGDAWVGGSAWVSGDAWVGGSDQILYGRHGGYDWTAYPTADGGWWIRYGCESHSLAWWQEQDLEALSVQHGHPPARWTRWIVQTVAALVEVARG